MIARWSRQRNAIRLIIVGGLIAAIFALLPAGRLACKAPYLTEFSPDKQWRIEVCARPRFFAMPGSGSDAPGWIVLRDSHDAIRGVSALTMLQLYGAMSSDTVWTKRSVSRGMVFALPLDPADGPLARWWGERLWHWRALVGLTPNDEDER